MSAELQEISGDGSCRKMDHLTLGKVIKWTVAREIEDKKMFLFRLCLQIKLKSIGKRFH